MSYYRLTTVNTLYTHTEYIVGKAQYHRLVPHYHTSSDKMWVAGKKCRYVSVCVCVPLVCLSLSQLTPHLSVFSISTVSLSLTLSQCEVLYIRLAALIGRAQSTMKQCHVE